MNCPRCVLRAGLGRTIGTSLELDADGVWLAVGNREDGARVLTVGESTIILCGAVASLVAAALDSSAALQAAPDA